MKRLFWAWLFLAALAAFGLLFARLLAPGWFELELDVYILFVGSLALLEVVLFARDSFPLEGPPEIAVALEHETEAPARPPELERLERELTMATATAFDLHLRLRPLLREVAGARLAARGLQLDECEDVVREELWELVRPDRPMPPDRNAPGIPAAELRRAVEAVEAL
ncbi:MAG TPA: hypothetical protein VKB10_10590 [Gaiellaceae bacterium]|nr:hypothetical protein [Gaiellaceae bacterium]